MNAIGVPSLFSSMGAKSLYWRPKADQGSSLQATARAISGTAWFFGPDSHGGRILVSLLRVRVKSSEHAMEAPWRTNTGQGPFFTLDGEKNGDHILGQEKDPDDCGFQKNKTINSDYYVNLLTELSEITKKCAEYCSLVGSSFSRTMLGPTQAVKPCPKSSSSPMNFFLIQLTAQI